MSLGGSQEKTQWWLMIVGALLAGVVTLVTGTVLFQWQTRNPTLSFRVQDTLPFAAPTETLGIYHVTLLNSGSSVAEDVGAVVTVPGAQIVGQRVRAEASLKIDETASPDRYSLHMATLNPNERVELSVLAKSNVAMPTRPTVSLRARGYVGEEQVEDNAPNLSKTLIGSLIAAYTGILSVLIFRRSIAPRILGRHSEDQREVLAYLCGMHGMVDEVERLLRLERKTTYWAEADRLGNIGATTADERSREAIKQILLDLLEYSSIADLSQGIVYFNIAKILANQGNGKSANQCLDKARKLGGKLIAKRLQIDPRMKVLNERVE